MYPLGLSLGVFKDLEIGTSLKSSKMPKADLFKTQELYKPRSTQATKCHKNNSKPWIQTTINSKADSTKK